MKLITGITVYKRVPKHDFISWIDSAHTYFENHAPHKNSANSLLKLRACDKI